MEQLRSNEMIEEFLCNEIERVNETIDNEEQRQEAIKGLEALMRTKNESDKVRIEAEKLELLKQEQEERIKCERGRLVIEQKKYRADLIYRGIDAGIRAVEVGTKTYFTGAMFYSEYHNDMIIGSRTSNLLQQRLK